MLVTVRIPRLSSQRYQPFYRRFRETEALKCNCWQAHRLELLKWRDRRIVPLDNIVVQFDIFVFSFFSTTRLEHFVWQFAVVWTNLLNSEEWMPFAKHHSKLWGWRARRKYQINIKINKSEWKQSSSSYFFCLISVYLVIHPLWCFFFFRNDDKAVGKDLHVDNNSHASHRHFIFIPSEVNKKHVRWRWTNGIFLSRIAPRSGLLIKFIFIINYSFTFKAKTFWCENLIADCGNNSRESS